MLKSTCPELSNEVQRVLKEHGSNGVQMTLKAASARSGVTISQIHNMYQGRIVGCVDVMLFADAFGEQVTDWLLMCGYEKVAAIVSKVPKSQGENEFDVVLKQVPATKRPKARKAALQAVETVIVPIFTDAIAA